ncbi:MAG: sulfatase-like hydrolase/transferase [Planctomycetota bacterium]|nr:sulfatase-like hydrolase/transferase [Planctomycetota bacterium]
MRRLLLIFCILGIGWMIGAPAHGQERPNILWISTEDISPHLGCYGDPHAITPNLDRLAKDGVRYSHAFTTSGVCSPCRSGIITGMYQSTLGTHHMRCTATLPELIKPFPVYLREAGYYCTNSGKTDYQFKHPRETWDKGRKRPWRGRKDKTQPFFAVFNFTGTHEGPVANVSRYRDVTKDLKPEQRRDPAKLVLPPYYPDTPVVRDAWKRNYELITAMDAWAGGLIQQLKDDGLYEDTIIFFWSDHGVGLPRAKRWLYDSGTHIPLIVRVPEKWRGHVQGKPGTVSDQLVSSIDLGPTVLNIAGVTVPDHVQGRPFLGPKPPPARDYVYGARDRMDERYDIIRMVRDKRYKYIRNYLPDKTYYQYMNTPEKGQVMQEIRRLAGTGELPPAARALMSPTKPAEELYDTQADPHEIHDLARDPKHRPVLKRMRAAHLAWVKDTRDLGLIPEPIIAERTKALGSEYAILRQPGGEAYNSRVAAMAQAASSGEIGMLKLMSAMSDPDDVIRYWGATGIGNLGLTAKAPLDQRAVLMRNALRDRSSAVRTAAARALCRMQQPKDALPVLIKEMTEGTQWERLHAAIVLDELDEQARPVALQMKEGLKYTTGFNSNGKYRVRVINRALNELNGTNARVK